MGAATRPSILIFFAECDSKFGCPEIVFERSLTQIAARMTDIDKGEIQIHLDVFLSMELLGCFEVVEGSFGLLRVRWQTYTRGALGIEKTQ
jgi:hypothetical protein